MQLSEQEVVRRQKLTKLRDLGINPYPADLFPVDSNSKEIKQEYVEGKQVVIAGRLMVINIQGKASFGAFLGFLASATIKFSISMVFLVLFFVKFWEYKAAFFQKRTSSMFQF